MDVLTPAPPLEVKLRRWRTSFFKALVHLSLLIFLQTSTSARSFIFRLYFLCFYHFCSSSFFMSTWTFTCNPFCRSFTFNLQAICRSRFARCLSQLLIYYVVFCLVVFPVSALARYLISVFVSFLFPPLPSLPSPPSPISCCCIVSCFVLYLATRLITKLGWLDLLFGGRFQGTPTPRSPTTQPSPTMLIHPLPPPAAESQPANPVPALPPANLATTATLNGSKEANSPTLTTGEPPFVNSPRDFPTGPQLSVFSAAKAPKLLSVPPCLSPLPQIVQLPPPTSPPTPENAPNAPAPPMESPKTPPHANAKPPLFPCWETNGRTRKIRVEMDSRSQRAKTRTGRRRKWRTDGPRLENRGGGGPQNVFFKPFKDRRTYHQIRPPESQR